jgi:hypothetical protein
LKLNEEILTADHGPIKADPNWNFLAANRHRRNKTEGEFFTADIGYVVCQAVKKFWDFHSIKFCARKLVLAWSGG